MELKGNTAEPSHEIAVVKEGADFLSIPVPPAEMLDSDGWTSPFCPAPDLELFTTRTFLNDKSALFNEDHLHLLSAEIGFLWTNVANRRHMKRIVGEAEMPNFKGGKWQKARQERQLEDWFGFLPTFVITLDAIYRAEVSNIEFLALLEHELYHCGQQIDEFGFPKFTKSTGLPVFGMRGHDVEEFAGVVRRYGIEATGMDRVDFVRAAAQPPEIGTATIKQLCGAC